MKLIGSIVGKPKSVAASGSCDEEFSDYTILFSFSCWSIHTVHWVSEIAKCSDLESK